MAMERAVYQQFYYTSCTPDRSVFGESGYSLRGASEPKRDYLTILHRLTGYELPPDMRNETLSPDTAPLRLSLRQNDVGRRFLIHTAYRGDDFTGKRGRCFFSHVVECDNQNSHPLSAIQSWGADFWIWCDSDNLSKSLKPLASIEPGPYLTMETLSRFVRGEPVPVSRTALDLSPSYLSERSTEDRVRLVRAVLSAYLGVLRGERPRLFLVASPGVAATLIYVIARLLPRQMTGGVTFSTYETPNERLKRCPLQIAATMWRDFQKNDLTEDYYRQHGFAFNTFTLKGVTESVGSLPHVDHVLNLLVDNAWQEAESFLAKCDQFGANDSQALENATKYTIELRSTSLGSLPADRVDQYALDKSGLGLKFLLDDPLGRQRTLQRMVSGSFAPESRRSILGQIRASKHADEWIQSLCDFVLGKSGQRGVLTEELRRGSVASAQYLVENLLPDAGVDRARVISLLRCIPGSSLDFEARSYLLDLDPALPDESTAPSEWLRTASAEELRKLCKKQLPVRWKSLAVELALRCPWQTEPSDPAIAQLIETDHLLATEVVRSLSRWKAEGEFRPELAIVKVFRRFSKANKSRLFQELLENLPSTQITLWRSPLETITQDVLTDCGYPGHPFVASKGRLLAERIGAESSVFLSLCRMCVENLDSRCLAKPINEHGRALEFVSRTLRNDSRPRPSSDQVQTLRTHIRNQVSAWETIRSESTERFLNQDSRDRVEDALKALGQKVDGERFRFIVLNYLVGLGYPPQPVPTRHVLGLASSRLPISDVCTQLCRAAERIISCNDEQKGQWLFSVLGHLAEDQSHAQDLTKLETFINIAKETANPSIWQTVERLWERKVPKPFIPAIISSVIGETVADETGNPFEVDTTRPVGRPAHHRTRGRSVVGWLAKAAILVSAVVLSGWATFHFLGPLILQSAPEHASAIARNDNENVTLPDATKNTTVRDTSPTSTVTGKTQKSNERPKSEKEESEATRTTKATDQVASKAAERESQPQSQPPAGNPEPPPSSQASTNRAAPSNVATEKPQNPRDSQTTKLMSTKEIRSVLEGLRSSEAKTAGRFAVDVIVVNSNFEKAALPKLLLNRGEREGEDVFFNLEKAETTAGCRLVEVSVPGERPTGESISSVPLLLRQAEAAEDQSEWLNQQLPSFDKSLLDGEEPQYPEDQEGKQTPYFWITDLVKPFDAGAPGEFLVEGTPKNASPLQFRESKELKFTTSPLANEPNRVLINSVVTKIGQSKVRWTVLCRVRVDKKNRSLHLIERIGSRSIQEQMVFWKSKLETKEPPAKTRYLLSNWADKRSEAGDALRAIKEEEDRKIKETLTRRDMVRHFGKADRIVRLHTADEVLEYWLYERFKPIYLVAQDAGESIVFYVEPQPVCVSFKLGSEGSKLEHDLFPLEKSGR
jgi:hypothetical protein